jgi:hypothetical protein
VFTDEEQRRLLDATKGTSFDARRDRAIISLFMDSGPLLGELVGLAVADVDLDNNLMLVDGKTGPRQVPIGARAAEDIDRYLRARRSHPLHDSPALWLGKKGKLTNSGVAQLLKRRGRQAGVADVRPHRFRHTFGHQWRMGGGNEGELMTVAGWKSDAMVRRYGRSVAGERAREAHGSSRRGTGCRSENPPAPRDCRLGWGTRPVCCAQRVRAQPVPIPCNVLCGVDPPPSPRSAPDGALCSVLGEQRSPIDVLAVVT